MAIEAGTADNLSSLQDPDNPAWIPSGAIILLSGGLDSVTALRMTQATFPTISLLALHVQYGQKHVVAESRKARDYCNRHNLASKIVTINPSLPGSTLTDLREEGAVTADTTIPATYVPGRNLILASIATAYAEAWGFDLIVCGANCVDYSGYPDCRPEFLVAMNAAIALGTVSGTERNHRIRYVAPLLYMTKVQVVEHARDLGIDLDATHSCYFPKPDGRPCDACDSCRIRADAIEEANKRVAERNFREDQSEETTGPVAADGSGIVLDDTDIELPTKEPDKG